MKLPENISILEVSPRDGLQSEKTVLSPSQKLKFIDLLLQSGIQKIEATSFVDPKIIPQLADHNEVMMAVMSQNNQDISYSALIPNKKGLENALKCHCNHFALLTAASESFCQHNLNCSITESLLRIKEITTILKKKSAKSIRIYISCAIYCPYEGKISPRKLEEITKQCKEIYCDEIVIGETTGLATAHEIIEAIKIIQNYFPINHIALHNHDTYGQALTNIYAAIMLGLSKFDSSTAGIGGCPYAPGAAGNVATEDLVYLCNGLGIQTNIDLDKLIKASNYISSILNISPRSKVSVAKNALMKKMAKKEIK